MKNVLILEALEEHTLQEFNAIDGYHFTYCPDRSQVTEEMLGETDVILGAPTKEMVAKAPRLSWVQLFSAGANTFGWLPENVTLTNAYGGYGAGMSEHMLACVLMVMKLFPSYMAQQQDHVWARIQGLQMIAGAKVVSVGMGGIGTEFLKRCHALGAECYGVRRSLHDKPDFVEKLYTMDNMDEILKEADVIALSMPETPETVHMFDYERLSSLKKGSIIVNVGRGSAIVQDDLIALCRENHFLGVCLDVAEHEPLPKNDPLWNTPHVYITPHVSGGFRSPANYENVMRTVKANLQKMADGQEPVHIVDRKIGY